MTFPHSAWSFSAIFASCIAGALTLSPWAIVASAAALVIVATMRHQAHYTRYSTTANVGAQSMLLAASSLNALATSAIAFCVGRGIALLWGL